MWEGQCRSPPFSGCTNMPWVHQISSRGRWTAAAEDLKPRWLWSWLPPALIECLVGIYSFTLEIQVSGSFHLVALSSSRVFFQKRDRTWRTSRELIETNHRSSVHHFYPLKLEGGWEMWSSRDQELKGKTWVFVSISVLGSLAPTCVNPFEKFTCTVLKNFNCCHCREKCNELFVFVELNS